MGKGYIHVKDDKDNIIESHWIDDVALNGGDGCGHFRCCASNRYILERLLAQKQADARKKVRLPRLLPPRPPQEPPPPPRPLLTLTPKALTPTRAVGMAIGLLPVRVGAVGEAAAEARVGLLAGAGATGAVAAAVAPLLTAQMQMRRLRLRRPIRSRPLSAASATSRCSVGPSRAATAA